MFEIPIENTEDFLNLVLAIGFTAITFFLCLVLVRLFRVLGTLEETLEEVQEIVELVQNYPWQPARFVIGIIDKIKRLLGLKK